jgi:gas vesicle protein
MTEERNTGTSGIILSFILGGLTGAALAILFAPRSGKETRELLGEKFREGAEKGRQIKDRIGAKAREVIEDATDYVERQREVLERRKDRLAAAVDAGRQTFREEKEKM